MRTAKCYTASEAVRFKVLRPGYHPKDPTSIRLQRQIASLLNSLKPMQLEKPTLWLIRICHHLEWYPINSNSNLISSNSNRCHNNYTNSITLCLRTLRILSSHPLTHNTRSCRSNNRISTIRESKATWAHNTSLALSWLQSKNSSLSIWSNQLTPRFANRNLRRPSR